MKVKTIKFWIVFQAASVLKKMADYLFSALDDLDADDFDPYDYPDTWPEEWARKIHEAGSHVKWFQYRVDDTNTYKIPTTASTFEPRVRNRSMDSVKPHSTALREWPAKDIAVTAPIDHPNPSGSFVSTPENAITKKPYASEREHDIPINIAPSISSADMHDVTINVPPKNKGTLLHRKGSVNNPPPVPEFNSQEADVKPVRQVRKVSAPRLKQKDDRYRSLEDQVISSISTAMKGEPEYLNPRKPSQPDHSYPNLTTPFDGKPFLDNASSQSNVDDNNAEFYPKLRRNKDIGFASTANTFHKFHDDGRDRLALTDNTLGQRKGIYRGDTFRSKNVMAPPWPELSPMAVMPDHNAKIDTSGHMRTAFLKQEQEGTLWNVSRF